MNAGGSSKTAEELLGDLLTEPEHIAVLQYANEHDLKKDDVVYFMVALLKVFAFVHQKILRAIKTAQERQSAMEFAMTVAERDLERSIKQQIKFLEEAISTQLGFQIGQLDLAAREIKRLNQELERMTKEARGTYHAYKRLADDGTGATLSQMFQRQAQEALNRQLPHFDETLRTLLARETRKLAIINVLQFVVLIVLLIIFRM